MRFLGLGVSSAVVCLWLASPALAEPIQAAEKTQQNGPLFVNDHDGGVIPNRVSDPTFVINPDGDDEYGAAYEEPNQDQDEDGDISMYQGQDDSIPA
jgi:hypothetical protein